MGWLKVADALLLSATPVEPPLGVVDSTVGGLAKGASSAASPTPGPESLSIAGAGSDPQAPANVARISEKETVARRRTDAALGT
jgi:hypothetical protein